MGISFLQHNSSAMEFFPSDTASSTRDAATLVLPALSIGNVGQLTVDLIISSLQAQKIGFLDDPNVLPCVGNDPFATIDSGELTVALEVYEAIEYGLRVVQQRAPVVKGTMLKFAKNLALWASSCNAKQIIILSGLDASKQLRHDIGSAQVRYFSTANPDGMDEQCEKLGWKMFEDFLPSSDAWKLLELQSLHVDEDHERCEIPLTDEMYYPSLPVSSLYSCCKAQGLNVLCILCFCSEGDNIQDAFFLGEALQKLLVLGDSDGQRSLKWAIPHSWKTVYGPPPDKSMFY